jgi:hypothetical protein
MLLRDPPRSFTLAEWHDVLAHVRAYIDTANHLMAVEEKRTFDAQRARPVFFKPGAKVILLTPFEVINKMFLSWTAGYEDPR